MPLMIEELVTRLRSCSNAAPRMGRQLPLSQTLFLLAGVLHFLHAGGKDLPNQIAGIDFSLVRKVQDSGRS